ncbi:hypothetical protein B9T31_09075 [Acinetobacter sp. ANC 4558]|uniref:hypothetical protein n=1 Tax=Acinetobacter sp. ANC 4558 TaxID=1977876 RepID=UPI000A3486EA|nr:hypothetical protein [Acinetobacter sp. ANC 4558]OTG86180.1 hypothetical protein B9T31_09075 [Acinetobacter sp. ANC 4558]
MMTQKQTLQFLEQLQKKHPQAIKRSYLCYGFIQTKGALDELKEIIPWAIALTTFIPLVFFLSTYIQSLFDHFSNFQAQASAIICIMLFFMLILPLVIYQIQHTSPHLYKHIKNLPFKLAALIVLQAINIQFFENLIFQGILFFLSLSYGFVALYKENLFKSHATSIDQISLNQIRRACFWSHLQILKCKLKLLLTPKHTSKYISRLQEKKDFITLHQELIQLENQVYKAIKYIDLESYVDELMK